MPVHIVGWPEATAKNYPVPLENSDHASKWIAAQVRAELQAEKARKPSAPPPPAPRKGPTGCCHEKRRCSNASSISTRSFRHLKRQVADICHRQEKGEKAREREKRETLEVNEREKLERERDDRILEKMERKINEDKERHRMEEFISNHSHCQGERDCGVGYAGREGVGRMPYYY